MLSHFCYLVDCIGRCYCQSLLWQILLPILMADVIAISVWWMLLPLKGGSTIKNLLMAPKDKDPICKKSGVIYRYKCDRVEYDEEYIGELARNIAERFKEHLKAPSPIYDHSNISGHTVTIENFSILGREDQKSH